MLCGRGLCLPTPKKSSMNMELAMELRGGLTLKSLIPVRIGGVGWGTGLEIKLLPVPYMRLDPLSFSTSVPRAGHLVQESPEEGVLARPECVSGCVCV